MHLCYESAPGECDVQEIEGLHLRQFEWYPAGDFTTDWLNAAAKKLVASRKALAVSVDKWLKPRRRDGAPTVSPVEERLRMLTRPSALRDHVKFTGLEEYAKLCKGHRHERRCIEGWTWRRSGWVSLAGAGPKSPGRREERNHRLRSRTGGGEDQEEEEEIREPGRKPGPGREKADGSKREEKEEKEPQPIKIQEVPEQEAKAILEPGQWQSEQVHRREQRGEPAAPFPEKVREVAKGGFPHVEHMAERLSQDAALEMEEDPSGERSGTGQGFRPISNSACGRSWIRAAGTARNSPSLPGRWICCVAESWKGWRIC